MRFIDLAEQYRLLKDRIDGSIHRVLEHGKYIMGPEVGELEGRLGEYADVKHVITCSSGTDALMMPLMAWGVGRGDAVFTTTFTFAATAEVISLLGAVPVLVDIDADTFNIDVHMLEKAIQRVKSEGSLKPKAIIPVDLFGLPADYDAISIIAKEHGLKVLEDAAQSFGSIYRGKKGGTFGDAAATSFFPAKPLGCYGDGGAVLTNDDGLAEMLRSIRVHGQGMDKYDNVRIGVNGRLDTIQAAILLAKLDVFDEELKARNRIASRYTRGMGGVVKTPYVPEGLVSSWAQYSVLAADSQERAFFREKLKAAGIPTAVYYPKPLHLQTAYLSLCYRDGDFPAAENTSSRIFSLPMHPYLSDEAVDRVTEILSQVVCSSDIYKNNTSIGLSEL